MKGNSLSSVVKILLLLIVAVSCNSGKMNSTSKLIALRDEVREDLTGNILLWWTGRMVDTVNGGFYGRADVNDNIYPDAERGGVVNSRILWTYSSAFRILRDSSYLQIADAAKKYLSDHFIDKEYGGAYRSVDFTGNPLDTRKQIYIESFFIYAFSEYARATGDSSALETAIEIYNCIERYAFDKEYNGYFELFDRKWNRLRDRLIGEKDDQDEKTMNTHLHLLESYTSLYRVWPDKQLGEKLHNLISIFTDKITDKSTYHLVPFMKRNWEKTSDSHSYGHDIEASWLLCEAASLTGDKELISGIEEISLKIADAASEGLFQDGSMATEKNLLTGHVTSARSWWEQAETVVGYVNAFEISGWDKYLEKAVKCWDYIKDHFIDKQNGGWFSTVTEDGMPGKTDKAGFWICPYHNGRMCLELTGRVK